MTAKGRACLLAAALAAATPGAVSAEEITVHGSAFGRVERVFDRENMLNADNILNVPQARGEATVLLDARSGPVTGNFKISRQEETGIDDGDASKLTVRELYVRTMVTDDLLFSIGRQIRQWDIAYGSHPWGFFDSEIRLNDIEDRYGNAVGLPMMSLQVLRATWDLELAYSDDFLSQPETLARRGRPKRQFAAKASSNVDGAQLYGIAHIPDNERPGLGGGFSQVFGTALEVHGAFMARQGTARPIHASVLNGVPRFYGADENPYVDSRKRDNKIYVISTIGGQWTASGGLAVTLEWIHDETGLNRSEWRAWRDLVAFHYGTTMAPQAARYGNLRQDARTLSSSGARRDYLFVRLADNWGDFAPQMASLVGVADGSASLNLRLTYTGARNWDAWIEGRLNTGRPGSEFGMVPEKGYVGTTFRVLF